MQNFIEKVSDSKGKLLVGLGGAAIVGLFGFLYRQYKNQETTQQVTLQEIKPQAQPFDLKKQIAKFKLTANFVNPSLQEVKQMIAFSFDMTFKEIERIHDDFKVSRRLVKNQGNLKQYFKTVGVGMIRLRQIGATLQQAIMIEMGVNPEIFVPYQNELSQFIYEQQNKRTLGSDKATLGDIKSIINKQINLLKQHGNQLVSNIVQYCKQWEIQAKKFIPDVFTVYMTDELAQKNPQIDNFDMRGAQKRFEKYLTAQSAMMKQQMQPLIARLISQLGMYQNAPQQQ